MSVFNNSFFEHIAEICLSAGKAIIREYEKPIAKVSVKPDLSPVTEADLRADEIIVDKLYKFEKTIPCFSEESITDEKISDQELYWAVDPLDGTEEFLKKTGDFSVNIGLIKKKKPIFGIVYAPVFDTIWLGYLNGKNGRKASFCCKNFSKQKNLLINSKKMTVTLPLKQTKVLTSRNQPSLRTRQWLNQHYKGRKINIAQRGSSIKICLIAEGKAHIYPRMGRTCIWDTAAGHAILSSAGGFLSNINSFEELIYSGNIYNPPFLASSFEPSFMKT